jgi:SAM-dependent methyltransferase
MAVVDTTMTFSITEPASPFYQPKENGLFVPISPVQHRDSEYPESGFRMLLTMQDEHFWYRGRHRFILQTLLGHLQNKTRRHSMIDLGGGVGGWLRYLGDQHLPWLGSMALADSSELALEFADSVLPAGTQRYQVDLMDLRMSGAWDVACMLDVIEHLPDDLGAIKQAAESLKSGGLLVVTTPAFPQFWSYNDEIAHHMRRYRRKDFVRLASMSGLTLIDARYFMFFLSPLYIATRLLTRVDRMTEEQKRRLVDDQHRVPSGPINAVLTSIFELESRVGHRVPFPWGTSILGVFQKS